MYEGDDDNAVYSPDIPPILDADFGSYLILASIAGIFMAVIMFGLSIWALVLGLLMAALIVFGIALILRGDEEDSIIQQNQMGDRIPTGGPEAYRVQYVAGDQMYTSSPMYPDTMLSSPYDVYNDLSYAYPSRSTARPEPGRCAECGNKLFLGRENCPHCATPVSHLDLNDS